MRTRERSKEEIVAHFVSRFIAEKLSGAERRSRDLGDVAVVAQLSEEYAAEHELVSLAF